MNSQWFAYGVNDSSSRHREHIASAEGKTLCGSTPPETGAELHSHLEFISEDLVRKTAMRRGKDLFKLVDAINCQRCQAIYRAKFRKGLFK